MENFTLGRFVVFQQPKALGKGSTDFILHVKRWLLPLIIGAGRLISGILTYLLVPEAEGHGTDSAIEAFHFKKVKS